jgi:hypothetical protein
MGFCLLNAAHEQQPVKHHSEHKVAIGPATMANRFQLTGDWAR